MKTNQELTHMHADVYKDEVNRLLLVDRKNQKAYLLSKKQQKQEEVLKNRYIMDLLTLFFVGYIANWVTGVIVGILLFLILEVVYYKLFIPSLDEIKCKNIPEKTSIVDLYRQDSVHDLWIRLFACVMFPILFVIFVYLGMKDSLNMTNLGENEVVVILLILAITVACLYIAAICLYLIIKKRKA